MRVDSHAPEAAGGAKNVDTPATAGHVSASGVISARRPLRKPQDRGLPSHADLVKLAKAFLDHQHSHWEELASQGHLPPNTPEHTEQMATDYTARFRSGHIQHPEFGSKGLYSWRAVAACYLRYSCENSNPRSLDDQLAHVLKAARAAGHFIPWDYVLADSSISGTIAVRKGYCL